MMPPGSLEWGFLAQRLGEWSVDSLGREHYYYYAFNGNPVAEMPRASRPASSRSKSLSLCPRFLLGIIVGEHSKRVHGQFSKRALARACSLQFGSRVTESGDQ
jgi:hypothetical protein